MYVYLYYRCTFILTGHGSAAYLFLTIKRFPVESYKPLRDPPISDVAKATELASCLERLLPAVRLKGGGKFWKCVVLECHPVYPNADTISDLIFPHFRHCFYIISTVKWKITLNYKALFQLIQCCNTQTKGLTIANEP